MATGSLGMLVQNLRNLPAGLMAFANNTGPNLSILKKIKDRQWKFGPESIRLQEEVYEDLTYKRHLCQHKNMWIDTELQQEVSQKDVAALQHFKMDGWRVIHAYSPLFLFGPLGLILLSFYWGNITYQPQTMAQTPDELNQWRQAQDLLRYKHTPALLANFYWWITYNTRIREEMQHAWWSLFDKNDIRRDPKDISRIATWIEKIQPFSWIRRQQVRAMARCMGIPSFPAFGKICLQTRVRDYWELAWNEDYMVLTQNLLEGMSDEELYDFAWRRFLAPYDKGLNREEVLTRIRDYHAVLGDEFVTEQKTPNIFVLFYYCLGYYNDPSYLELDFTELSKNDFEHLSDMPKDAFMRRLEFENGALRDQVEAYTHQLLKERQEEEAKKQLAS